MAHSWCMGLGARVNEAFNENCFDHEGQNNSFDLMPIFQQRILSFYHFSHLAFQLRNAVSSELLYSELTQKS